jgi:4-hydroxy-tetrahydrodipicolinate reductase
MSDAPLRITIIGDGLMGRTVHALAEERGILVMATLGRDVMHDDPGTTSEVLRNSDVALEFTTPSSAVPNIALCLDAGCPVVVGTTGWYDQLSTVESAVDARNGALLWAPNFSLGMALLMQLVKRAGHLAASLDQFDVQLLEIHHSGKRDAPSGTAISLERVMARELGRPIPITSVRQGHVPGTHEVTLDSPFERITLAHEARDRRVFADGALVAARWLSGRTGVYTIADVFAVENT